MDVLQSCIYLFALYWHPETALEALNSGVNYYDWSEEPS